MTNDEKLVLNVKEVSLLLGLAKNSIYSGILAGEIPHVKVGKRILIPRAALEKLLAEAGNKTGDVPR